MKCRHQTVAIDVWSVGVVLLSILTRRYPFFNAVDDFDALAELATLFTAQELQSAGLKFRGNLCFFFFMFRLANASCRVSDFR